MHTQTCTDRCAYTDMRTQTCACTDTHTHTHYPRLTVRLLRWPLGSEKQLKHSNSRGKADDCFHSVTR